MKKLGKIEDKINTALEKAGNRSVQFAKKCTPQNIKKFSKKKKEQFIKKNSNLKHLLKIKQKKILKTAVQSKTIALKRISASKEQVNNLAKVAKSTDFKKLNYKAIFLSLIAFASPLFLRLTKWILAFKPATIATAISITVLTSITGVGVYQNSKKIIDQTRSPASEKAPEQINVRPDYYKDNQKVFLIRNITLPVYLDSVSKSKRHSIRKIIIDLTFLSSNKYIKAYFWENAYRIHDKINSELEPISIDFPLEAEGKKIIKSKVKQLVNELIKELSIKGHIKKVYFNGEVGA